MRGVTREEAVLYLLSLTDRVDLTVQYKREEYERLRMNNLGDNFFIRLFFFGVYLQYELNYCIFLLLPILGYILIMINLKMVNCRLKKATYFK